jgi:acyl carrier protein
MNTIDGIEQAIKQYILSEFLAGEDPAQLTDSTPLVSTGILDSIALLKLVLHLEQSFSISLEPDEADADHLNTIGQVAELVRSKLSRVSQ